ncbi:hypothetical protein ACFX2C_008504 [Malus domestica]
MERVLNLLRSRLRLNEGEDIEVEFSDMDNERLKLSKFFVVRKVLTRKKFRPTIVMGVIKELWKPKVAVEAMAIGEDWEAIGRVVKVDCDAYGGCVGEFLHLRVGMDVTLPLKRGLKDIVWNVVEGWSTYIGFEEDMNYMEVDDNGEFIRVTAEEGWLCKIRGTGLQVEQGGVINESGEKA